MNSDLKKKKCVEDEKVALFYTKIDNKNYYYSYEILSDDILHLYESYVLASPSQARRILKEQLDA
ncbi:MAG: hypothetical protein Q4C29_01280 [bacterium]|mgnify:CR=1 FL=1|nr:hypothetical protein [bacterium]